MTKIDLHKKDIVYFARIIPNIGIYEICELLIRTLNDDYFVGVDKKDKHAYLFSSKALNETVFKKREQALDIVRKAEKYKRETSEERYYEEY